MALTATNIGLNFSGARILNGVDLTLEPGKVTVLLGPNGTGKTSLLRILTGELQPHSGSVALNGTAINEWPADQRARLLGVLPQLATLNFPFTVQEVVQLGRTPHSTGQQKDREIVNEALALVDGSYLAKRYYTQLSGGEKQRVQLARVLAQIWQPSPDDGAHRCLILDEPTSSFDLCHQQLMMSVVRRFAEQGVAVCLVLHDLNLAVQCADHIGLLCCGELVASGTPAEVMTPELLRRVFTADIDVIEHPKTGKPLIIT